LLLVTMSRAASGNRPAEKNETMKTKLKAVPNPAPNEAADEECATFIAALRALPLPDVGRANVDQIEHEVAMIDVLIPLLESDVSELGVLAKRHPYLAEIEHRLSTIRAHIALERMNWLTARGAK
jgi:hypothetical protein